MKQELSMANTKNEGGKTSSTDNRQTGADTGAGGKVSAGSSVGNIGEAPMPRAHENASQGASQGSTQASGASAGSTGSGQSSQQNASQQNAQGGAADQVRQRASEAFEGATDWARDTYERATDWASDSYEQQRRRMNRMGGRSGKAFGNARGGVQSYVSENPMVVGLVGLATGLLLGALLPRTRRENEVFGHWADEVRNQGLRYAREAASRGRDYVEETFSGDDAQFSRHDSEFRPGSPDANRH